MLDQRPEGIYVNPCTYPDKGLLGSTSMTKIERVRGDCKVATIIVAPSELEGLITDLKKMLQRQRAGG